jgi:hypothetical protein
MTWAAIAFLILVAIFGLNVFRAVGWIFILGIIALAIFGATLPDPPKSPAPVQTSAPKGSGSSSSTHTNDHQFSGTNKIPT